MWLPLWRNRLSSTLAENAGYKGWNWRLIYQRARKREDGIFLDRGFQWWILGCKWRHSKRLSYPLSWPAIRTEDDIWECLRVGAESWGTCTGNSTHGLWSYQTWLCHRDLGQHSTPTGGTKCIWAQRVATLQIFFKDKIQFYLRQHT